jgi:hypothetical protein
MIKRFGLSANPAIVKMAEIVREMDLKGGKFNTHDEARLNAVMHGPGELLKDDWKLVRQPGRSSTACTRCGSKTGDIMNKEGRRQKRNT